MSASFADFTVWDVKLREPRDKATARLLEVEAEVAGRSGTACAADNATEEIEETLCEEPCRGRFWRLNWRALARAFS